MPSTLEVDVHGRRGVVRLLERLCFSRVYLVQQGPERWVVHAEVPRLRGETLEDAVTAIEELSRAGHLDATSVRIDGLAFGRALTEAPTSGRSSSLHLV
jgi:hypothetical protein